MCGLVVGGEAVGGLESVLDIEFSQEKPAECEIDSTLPSNHTQLRALFWGSPFNETHLSLSITQTARAQ